MVARASPPLPVPHFLLQPIHTLLSASHCFFLLLSTRNATSLTGMLGSCSKIAWGYSLSAWATGKYARARRVCWRVRVYMSVSIACT